MYSQSIYNIYFENYNHDAVLFNTLSGNLLRIPADRTDRVLPAVNQPDACRNRELLQYLEQRGFLVRDPTEETEKARQLFESFIDSNRQYILTIMPTEGCNFRCPYCFESHQCGKINKKIEKNILAFVERILSETNVLSLNWYGGEPLLEIDSIVRLSSGIKALCKEKRKTFLASITTNGYLLTYENYLKLKAGNVLSYAVTLDGLPEYHNKTRPLANGDPSFETIFSNLKQIQQLEKSHLVRFAIRTNYTAESIKGKAAWEEYLNRNLLFDKRFQYVPRFAWNNRNSQYADDQYIPFELNDNINLLHEIPAEVTPEAHRKLEGLLSDGSGFAFAEQHLRSLVKGDQICPAGCRNSIVLGPDGTAYKCQVALDSPENKVGILKENGEIAFNDHLSRWVKQKPVLPDGTDCLRCVLFPLCRSTGCPAKTNLPENVDRIWWAPLLKEVKKYLHILTYRKSPSDMEDRI